ncbi:hypothetical protein NPIL_518611 [Nephila pilipes]|uniref:Uncharacterized protein n=1 Tax=Nephila pilipes TaxID=299642 RepID=A0A8X6QZT5_NEPPI|nr:hypothetical protein NPIL_518611 [Nephila pilipes]
MICYNLVSEALRLMCDQVSRSLFFKNKAINPFRYLGVFHIFSFNRTIRRVNSPQKDIMSLTACSKKRWSACLANVVLFDTIDEFEHDENIYWEENIVK